MVGERNAGEPDHQRHRHHLLRGNFEPDSAGRSLLQRLQWPPSCRNSNDWQQIFVAPYSLITDGGINPNTANEFIFALHFTRQTAVGAVQYTATVQVRDHGESDLQSEFLLNHAD